MADLVSRSARDKRLIGYQFPDMPPTVMERLYGFVLEIENQEERGYRKSPRSLNQLASVVIVHDGSKQGHNAEAVGRNVFGTSRV